MLSDDLLSRLRDLKNAGTITPSLEALSVDAEGGWEVAHEIVQDYTSGDGAWVHAYLHRKEGDSTNAAYWYRRAKKPVYEGSLEEEWQDIVTTLLKGKES